MASQALHIVGHVVVTPMYVVFWGAAEYGLWLSISAAVTYIAYADLGLAGYIMPRLMRSHALNDWNTFDSEFHSALAAAFALLLTLAGLAALTAVIFWMSGTDLHLVLIAALMALTALLQFAQSFLVIPYAVSGNQQRIHLNALAYAALVLATNVIVLLAKGRPIHLALMHAVIGFVRVVVTWWDAGRLAPRMRPALSKASGVKIRELLPRSVERGLAVFITLLGKQGPLLAISASMGTSAAATFSTARTLVNFSRMSSEMLGNAVYTEFTDLDAREDHKTLARLLRVASGAAMSVTFPILAVLIVFGSDIFEAWMRGKLQADGVLFVLLCIEAFAMMPLLLIRVVLLATNQHRSSVWADGVTTLLMLAFTYLGTRWFGILAAPLAVLVFQAPWFGYVVISEVSRVARGLWTWRTILMTWSKGTILTALGCLWCVVLSKVTGDVLVLGVAGLAGAQAIGLLGWWLWMLDSVDRELVTARAAIVVAKFRRNA